MGDSAEPFREMGHAHLRNSEVGDFNFSACETELGFNFDMGLHIDSRGDASETSTSVNNGVEAFFELSDAAKSFCVAGYGALGEAGGDTHAFSEEGDDLMIGWVSPRISFSQDLSMDEPEAPRTIRAFPEKRKRQGGAGNGELNDGCSSEFEFLSNGVVNDGVVRQTKDMMLSADELFSDGKLLPMQTQEMASPNGDLGMQGSKLSSVHLPQLAESRGNEPGMLSRKLTLQESYADEPNAAEAHEKLMARHLSLELPRPNSSSTTCGLAPLVSVSVDNSPCSSPPRSSAPPPNACIAASSTSPALHKPGSKYTSKIKDFFKPKRVSSSMSPQLTRDNSTISTCRIPIPPRSFWPFSRSNSAGESKTALPSLPPRSNSSGDSNTSRVAKKSNDAGILELNKNSCNSHEQAAMVSAREEDESHNITNTYMDVNSAKNCIDVGSSSNCTETSKQVNTEEECAPTSTSSQQAQRSRIGSQKGKASGSPGRAARKRYMYTTANFLRGSPGRRGGMNSLVKANASRIVLKNLERCSADRKLCRETSGRRAGAYPVALRVTPVINVAVYRGKVPSAGMFGLRSLFSSKKEKAKEKDAAINNWRAGA